MSVDPELFKKIPHWASFAAQDQIGNWRVFEKRPSAEPESGKWRQLTGGRESTIDYSLEVLDWRCSLICIVRAQVPIGAGDAIVDIAAERMRQIETHGHSADRDDAYIEDELRRAAFCYLSPDHYRPANGPPVEWPWDFEAWRPSDRRSDLIKASALIAAEIDRRDRAEERRNSQWCGHPYFVPLPGNLWAGEVLEVVRVTEIAGQEARITGARPDVPEQRATYPANRITSISGSSIKRINGLDKVKS